MGVLKWLRRERVTVTTSQSQVNDATHDPNAEVGTVRTEQYKRDLAEFQARRSLGGTEQETPKKKCGRRSLPASCTNCAGDSTVNYEKKSDKKNKRNRAYSEEKSYGGVPNIQFLFQNQVFMPGDIFTKVPYTEPRRNEKRRTDELKQRRIEFHNEPPLFYKNNELQVDTNLFLKGTEEIDGFDNAIDKNVCDDKLWEAMSELKDLDQWADEQLQDTTSSSKTEDTKSTASTLGLPIASSCSLNVAFDKHKCWSQGRWDVEYVQLKKLRGVSMEQVRKKQNLEINLLRKCRHPNIILLMALYRDVNDDVHIVCERMKDSLYGILHEQGHVLSVQTAVHYTLDIAKALAFLKMHGYLHTDLHSSCIMITAYDTAKLADLSPCTKARKEEKIQKTYVDYSSEPVYVNIEDTQKPTSPESEPLISARSSECYLKDGVKKDYKSYRDSEYYRWQAPELFDPDEEKFVYPCSKSDVYSLCLVLWECCNAQIPWQSHTYEKLKDTYNVWKVGLRLPKDGTYPGSVLDLLQKGLHVGRDQRLDLTTLRSMLQTVKENLDKLEYIVIPLRAKKSDFSSQWDSTSPTDSDSQTPKIIQHNAMVHPQSSSTDSSPMYHTIQKYDQVDKCFVYDEQLPTSKYDNVEKGYSSNCSTPVAKFRKQNKEATPDLHRSDSTQYCSILSPHNIEPNDQSIKDRSTEPATAKLSRSFTPKSYKPLQITVPDCNFDSIRNMIKTQNGERASYSFDIKNYSLPNTPIARSTKLRKNAWLSGEFETNRFKEESADLKQISPEIDKVEVSDLKPKLENTDIIDKKESNFEEASNETMIAKHELKRTDSLVEESERDSYTGLRRISDPPLDFSFFEVDTKPSTCSTRSSSLKKVEEEVLANVNVKPLVAIHEKWIHEANKKNVRSFSLPEERATNVVRAVKPASHSVDTMLKSLPQLNCKPCSYRPYRASPVSPGASWKSGPFEAYFQSRDNNMMTKSINFPIRDEPKRQDVDKSTNTDDILESHEKVDQATETKNIDDYIRDLIRKELHSLCDLDVTECSSKESEDFLNKGVANVVEGLKENNRTIKSFSKVTINGNNKPLIQITFNNNERNLRILDKDVNVVVGENSKEKLNVSLDDSLTDELHIKQLKRCQAFNSIQEAKSTEDLYIDDDISTHMQENFGDRVKLIPLHGSMHELLCERDDDCCLIKIKQENGCDAVYFKYDTDSDVTDGGVKNDRVIFKRRFSLVEQRIQRVYSREKRENPIAALKLKTRPKSETFPKINKETRTLSNSSPSLYSADKEIELNIENVMSYESSSDECLKCSSDDDFEIIEREIEDEFSTNTLTITGKCLEKISEENLSMINDDEKY